MIKEKKRIIQLKKGKDLLKSLMLKYESQTAIISRKIKHYKNEINVMYSCLKNQNVIYNSNIKVAFATDNKPINIIDKWINQQDYNYVVGNMHSTNQDYIGEKTLATFEAFNHRVLKNQTSFTPIIFQNPIYEPTTVLLDNFMHLDNLLYLYNRSLWMYSIYSAYKAEYVERIKKNTQAFENCEEILCECERNYTKIKNNISINEIILQYGGKN